MGNARARSAGLAVLVLCTGMLAGCASLPTAPATPAAPYLPVAAATAEPAVTPIAIGMDAGQVGAMLGSPVMIMAEGPAEWWRYAKGDCAMDVFLLRDPATSRTQVTWVDSRTLAGNAACTLDDAGRPRRSAEAALPAVHLY